MISWHNRVGRVLTVLAVAATPLFLLTTNGHAADFTVDSAADSGPGTLRQALLDAQAGSDNVINVTPGLGTITLSNVLTYNANANLTINGNGVVVNANGSDGALRVAGDGNLTIDGMTLTGANATGSEAGALVKTGNAGNVALSNCSISGNTVSTGNNADVGAIDVSSGGTSIDGCEINSNHLTSGTAVDTAPVASIGGPLTVTNSDISGNTVSAQSGVVAGAIDSEGGPVTVTNTSITGNSVTTAQTNSDTAGAIASEGGTMTITNSTISGNTANAPAGQNANVSGGLLVFASSGEGNPGLAMVYVTLTNNTGGAGGNVFSPNPVTSFGSVVTGATPNCFFDEDAAMTSNGYNFSDDASCGFTDPTDHQSAGSPGLNALADNGGPGLTQLPEATSPLVDAIPTGSCQADGAAGITTDERGVTRPQFGGCDIGAIELNTQPTPEPQPQPPVTIQPKFTG